MTGWHRYFLEFQRRLAEDYGFGAEACRRMAMAAVSRWQSDESLSLGEAYWVIVNEEIAEPYRLPQWNHEYA